MRGKEIMKPEKYKQIIRTLIFNNWEKRIDRISLRYKLKIFYFRYLEEETLTEAIDWFEKEIYKYEDGCEDPI